MKTPPNFPCIAVTQPIGTFYVFSSSAKDILHYLSVSRRGLSPEEKFKVQRSLDEKRQREIASYVTNDEATFPTSITINADSEKILIIETNSGLRAVIGRELDEQDKSFDDEDILLLHTANGDRRFVALDNIEPVAEIIDGQHRFEGLRMAINDAEYDHELSQRLNKFELTLSIMFDLIPEQCAKVFVTINATQRKVDSSHIADLFALHSTRSPQRVCHLIAATFNELEDSPFLNGLKMLGKRVHSDQYLSQGSFIKYLMTLLPKANESGELSPVKNRDIERESRPLSDFYYKSDDETIGQILLDYFYVVSEVYETAWETDKDNYLIRKTVGFSALIKFLRKILPKLISKNMYTYDHFLAVLNEVSIDFPVEKWRVGNFASSDSEANRICNEMFETIRDRLEKILDDANTKITQQSAH